MVYMVYIIMQTLLPHMMRHVMLKLKFVRSVKETDLGNTEFICANLRLPLC
jgi:hypothetical protein